MFAVRQSACSVSRRERPLHTQEIQECHHLKDIEDELTDTLMGLDSLHDAADTLLDNYTECVRSSGQLYTRDHDANCGAFRAQMKDITLSRRNGQSLHTKMQGRNKRSTFKSPGPAQRRLPRANRSRGTQREHVYTAFDQKRHIRPFNCQGSYRDHFDLSANHGGRRMYPFPFPFTLPHFLTKTHLTHICSRSSQPNLSACNRARKARNWSWLQMHGCLYPLRRP